MKIEEDKFSECDNVEIEVFKTEPTQTESRKPQKKTEIQTKLQVFGLVWFFFL